MAKKASVKELLEALAKERGLEITALKKTSEKEKDDRNIIQRLEEGAGFAEAFAGAAKSKYESAKESITTTKGIKSLGKKAYMEFFGGKDIFSAYMRGRLKKGSGGGGEEVSERGLGGGNTSAHIAIIAKQSMAIQGMARDTNVMRQNLQQLVKIWGGKAATKKESSEERKKDIDYFAEQDRKEAAQEAARGKAPTPVSQETKTAVSSEGGGSFLDNIISLFSSGFMRAIKFFLNPKMLMKVFSKVFLPLTIIGTLFSGIMDGFKRYQETGSFTEAITAGLGGMLKFLSFGLFGEDTIKKIFGAVSEFFAPILKTVSDIFTGIKDFFKNLFGGEVTVEDSQKAQGAAVGLSYDEVAAATGAAVTPPASTTPAAAATPAAATPAAATPAAATPAAAVTPPASTTPAAATPVATTSPTPTTAQASTSAAASPVSTESRQQARANIESLQLAEKGLQELQGDWADERNEAITKLRNSGVSFSEDPNSPNYPKELRDIDEKYGKWIAIKKTEIERLKKSPGVQEELKRQEYNVSRLDELDRLNDTGATKKTKASKVGGSNFATTAASTGGAGGASISGQLSMSSDSGSTGSTGAVSSMGGSQSIPGESSGGGSLSGSISASVTSPSVTSPEVESKTPAGIPSGSAISSSSSEVAEGQRMEVTAEQGMVINNPTNNNMKQSVGQEKGRSADVYDSDLIQRLAVT